MYFAYQRTEGNMYFINSKMETKSHIGYLSG
jgi:hypothetical protein